MKCFYDPEIYSDIKNIPIAFLLSVPFCVYFLHFIQVVVFVMCFVNT